MVLAKEERKEIAVVCDKPCGAKPMLSHKHTSKPNHSHPQQARGHSEAGIFCGQWFDTSEGFKTLRFVADGHPAFDLLDRPADKYWEIEAENAIFVAIIIGQPSSMPSSLLGLDRPTRWSIGGSGTTDPFRQEAGPSEAQHHS